MASSGYSFHGALSSGLQMKLRKDIVRPIASFSSQVPWPLVGHSLHSCHLFPPALQLSSTLQGRLYPACHTPLLLLGKQCFIPFYVLGFQRSQAASSHAVCSALSLTASLSLGSPAIYEDSSPKWFKKWGDILCSKLIAHPRVFLHSHRICLRIQ